MFIQDVPFFHCDLQEIERYKQKNLITSRAEGTQKQRDQNKQIVFSFVL